MADEVDMTAEREERFAPFMIQNSRKPEGPKANGFCHFCDEPVAEGLRFCNRGCADDWEKRR